MTAKQAGRIEDEAALRDAVLLTQPGDFLSVGPAGLLLLAWRRLAARSGDELLTKRNLAAVLEEFGYAPDDEGVSTLTDDLRQLAASDGMVGMMTRRHRDRRTLRLCAGLSVPHWGNAAGKGASQAHTDQRLPIATQVDPRLCVCASNYRCRSLSWSRLGSELPFRDLG